MTKVKIEAVTNFSHGNLDAQQGGVYSINKGDAQELEKAGFVRLTGDDEPAAAEAKAAPVLSNKMAAEPENKGEAADLLGGDERAGEQQEHHASDVVVDAPAAPKTTTKKK